MNEPLVLSVSDFVAILNQTLDYAYPSVTIIGELSNFKVSKGKWIYFDLKDQGASVRFFGTIYALPGPLEDGMKLQVTGAPRLHPTFGFSVTAQKILPVGEGSIKKAAKLLEAKLRAEGLFASERKRNLPYPPSKIGLVASSESAAYADFVKILGQRWGGIEIIHGETQVQGESAPSQIVSAIERLNMQTDLEVIVITRGGGSADDLMAFSNELVVRAIAASRTPTLVAIGHEIDISLAEMAADVHASTPSNAAELLVPDRSDLVDLIKSQTERCKLKIQNWLVTSREDQKRDILSINQRTLQIIKDAQTKVATNIQTLHGYDPGRILRQGYALIKQDNSAVRTVRDLTIGKDISLRLSDGIVSAEVRSIEEV